MPPAARVTDMHTCPMVTGVVPHVGGPILPPCAVTVITGGLPQARVSDNLTCVGPPDVIVKGSATVIVSGLPAARLGDMTAHGGMIVVGFPTVLIGDAGGGGAGAAGLAAAAAIGNAAAQATAMIAAAIDGVPFCERCAAAAAKTPAPGATPPAKPPAGPAIGSAVTLDAATLKQSPTLAKQLDDLKKDGWRVEYGKAGGGSYASRGSKTITVDAAKAGNPAALAQTMSHEAGHALYKGMPDVSSRKAYVDSMLADEGAATLNNIKVQREMLANKGPDIGIAGNNAAKYNAAYDQFLKDGDVAKGRAAIGAVFGAGEKTSTTLQPYQDYYGGFYDANLKPKGKP